MDYVRNGYDLHVFIFLVQTISILYFVIHSSCEHLVIESKIASTFLSIEIHVTL